MTTMQALGVVLTRIGASDASPSHKATICKALFDLFEAIEADDSHRSRVICTKLLAHYNQHTLKGSV